MRVFISVAQVFCLFKLTNLLCPLQSEAVLRNVIVESEQWGGWLEDGYLYVFFHKLSVCKFIAFQC